MAIIFMWYPLQRWIQNLFKTCGEDHSFYRAIKKRTDGSPPQILKRVCISATSLNFSGGFKTIAQGQQVSWEENNA